MQPTTYSVSGYGEMITDTLRMEAYHKALQGAVKPGSVVLDIGAGTGICTLLACQLGARKVYAVEPSEAILVAQQIAQVNGYADRVEFIQAISTEITLPEPVDVIVSDLRGVLPLLQHHIPSLQDARRRFLAPNGILIPQCDDLWITVVENVVQYQSYTSPWNDKPYGLNMQAGLPFAINNWGKAKIKPEQLLVEPKRWAVLDYRSIENPNIHADLHWTSTRSATAHGLVSWFNATLVDGVTLSNAPDQPELIYGRAFLPWPEPVHLEPEDTLTVEIKADLVGNDYNWTWNTQILKQGNPDSLKASFQQSTFFGTPLSPKQMRKRSDHFTPTLNASGKVDYFILSLMEQGQSLGTIAQQLHEQFRDRFPTWKEALAHVGELSQQYSQ